MIESCVSLQPLWRAFPLYCWRLLLAAAQRGAGGRDIPVGWWGLFHSPQISTLVTQALKANPDVAAAQATLRQARETTRAEQGALFPSVGASAQVERQRESLAAFGFGNGSATFTTYGTTL